MAVEIVAQNIVKCLNTDTKPTTGYSSGTLLVEITEGSKTYGGSDSAKMFVWTGSAWTELFGVGNTTPTEIYVSPDGDDTYGDGSRLTPVATITAAMALVTATRKTIILCPGTYTEDVTWGDRSGILLAGLIPGTVTIEAVTAFAASIDPAASSGTWSATLQDIALSHGEGLVGLQVDNASVGKRINLYLNDVDIESEEPTDHAIDVNRSGEDTDAIRIYATGHGNTIEGLVHYITESTDDRLRFWGYRLPGGLTVSGAIVMEVTYVNCGIKTSGETYGTGNVTSHFGCYNETDDNPNVHTAVADDDDTSQE